MDDDLMIEFAYRISNLFGDFRVAVKQVQTGNINDTPFAHVFISDLRKGLTALRLLFLDDVEELSAYQDGDLYYKARYTEWFKEIIREVARSGGGPGVYFPAVYLVTQDLLAEETVEMRELAILEEMAEFIEEATISYLAPQEDE